MSTTQSDGIKAALRGCRPAEIEPIVVDAADLESTAPEHLRDLKAEFSARGYQPATLSVAARFDGGDTLATQREADRLRELVRAASFLGAGRIERSGSTKSPIGTRPSRRCRRSPSARAAKASNSFASTTGRLPPDRMASKRSLATKLGVVAGFEALAPRSNSTRRRRIWRLTSFISRISTATSTAEPFSTSAPGRECSRWRPPSVVPRACSGSNLIAARSRPRSKTSDGSPRARPSTGFKAMRRGSRSTCPTP